ncbi:MAG TPA: peptidoglycan DD-metalloendopeptidase family protein [Acidimicrobiales bacterium]|nr:peptidoglycan DD-metalloendopeptidase family protein [Acidimicrobiales bacterium]
MRRWALIVVLLVVALFTAPAQAQDDLATVRQKAKTAATRVADAQTRADKATAAYFEAESKYELLKVALAEQETALAGAEAEVARLKIDLRDFLVDQYTAQTDEFTFFSMSDINQALVQQSLTSVLADRKGTAIEDYRAAVKDLSVLTNQLDSQRNEQKNQVDYLASIKTQFTAEVGKLATEKANLDSLLVKLEAAEVLRIRAELAAKQEAARRRADEEARARTTTTTRRATAIATPVPTAPTRGASAVALVRCPVSGGASYSDTYGQPRGGGRLHIGVDLSAPVGTPVVAPVDGTVSFSSDGAGGRTFTMTGTDGNFYYGAHLSFQGPNSGTVKAGAVIGQVGQTGNASVPHLHLEIHLGGRGSVINPYPSVARVC